LDDLKTKENELKTLRVLLKEKENNFSNLTKQFEQERDEKMAMLDEKVKAEDQWKKDKQRLEAENTKLQTLVTNMEETVKKDGKIDR
jgi:hypothetical protein